LVGLGWGDSGHGSLADYVKFSNHIAEFFRIGDFYPQPPAPLRNVSISVCEMMDDVHVINSDQCLIVSIKD
jgi:hypothetical protein